uniref:Uncharacterized protein n=1 Tax=Glossina austeni TaxID=7395 RepID=A0A1A9VW78_GLOAU
MNDLSYAEDANDMNGNFALITATLISAAFNFGFFKSSNPLHKKSLKPRKSKSSKWVLTGISINQNAFFLSSKTVEIMRSTKSLAAGRIFVYFGIRRNNSSSSSTTSSSTSSSSGNSSSSSSSICGHSKRSK